MLVLTFTSCQRNKVERYAIAKSSTSTWYPLNSTEYILDYEKRKVMRDTAGILTEYSNCIIKDNENWFCKYDDGSGEFGFKQGEYFEYPKLQEVKEVNYFVYLLYSFGIL